MSDYENKKTAPDDSGVKGGMEKNEHSAALHIPAQKHTTTGPEVQGIPDILLHGAENAFSLAEVMHLCGIPGIRQLRGAMRVMGGQENINKQIRGREAYHG